MLDLQKLLNDHDYICCNHVYIDHSKYVYVFDLFIKDNLSDPLLSIDINSFKCEEKHKIFNDVNKYLDENPKKRIVFDGCVYAKMIN